MDTDKSKSNEAVAGGLQDTALREPVRRRVQNFLLIWLDPNLDETNEDFKNYLQQLRTIVASIDTFKDAQKCFDFTKEIETEKIFMIVSGSLDQTVVLEIEKLPQVDAIYAFSDNKEYHEQWAKNFKKIRGVYTKIEPICEQLKIDRESCDRSTVSISFNGIDPLFIYTQLLKETLLEIEDDDEKSIRELAHFCRDQGDIPETQIKQVERKYRDRSPIWWYTCPSFMYSTLNRGLRVMDTDIILKMGFFIRHLHNHIQELYEEQQSSSTKMEGPFTVYRGQGLSLEHFEKMKQTKGGLMSFNNFLSTSVNRQVSLKFALRATSREDSVGILFIITVDSQICRKSAVPFADVKDVGFYEGEEAELLFTTHTIFRIEKIQRLQDKHTGRLWEVNLTLVGNDDHELSSLLCHLREDVGTETGWSRLGYIFLKLAQPTKAEHLYKILLENATTDKAHAQYNYQLGWVYNDLGQYSKAISHFEKYLEYKKKTVPPNDLSLAAVYNNIGSVYLNMGEYSKALSSYELSLEIRKIVLPPNHPDLAASYDNIGLLYDNMGEYSKALSSHERSLEIRKIALPPNHPAMACSYNYVGMVYHYMGEYSKALCSYERSLEIKKIALPPYHLELAYSYNNIAEVYDQMGEYSKALLSYERCLEIWKKALPSDHASFGYSYNGLGLVYNNLGEYSKARASFEKAIEIREKALPPTHPDLATSYNDIGLMYGKMGNYKKSLTFLKKALDIRKKALPRDHPDTLKTETNITELKKKMKQLGFRLLLVFGVF